MLDAPFASLEADYSTALERGGRQHLLLGATGLAAGVVLGLLRAYKVLISPLFTGCCRFYPSCADYTSEAVALHGAGRGLWLGTRRLSGAIPWAATASIRSPTADPRHGTPHPHCRFSVVPGAVRATRRCSFPRHSRLASDASSGTSRRRRSPRRRRPRQPTRRPRPSAAARDSVGRGRQPNEKSWSTPRRSTRRSRIGAAGYCTGVSRSIATSQGEPVDLVPSAVPAGSADAILAACGR